KRTITDKDENGQDIETQIKVKRFVFKRNWFMLAQTDGAPYTIPATPAWDRNRALATLQVEEIPFHEMNGNVQGYSSKRQFAINPLAELPTKTLFHELAHIELGHTKPCTIQRHCPAL